MEAGIHTDFACYIRIQTAEDNVTLRELAGLALLHDQVTHGTHGGGLLPPDGIAVLLACGLRRGANSDKLEEWVVL